MRTLLILCSLLFISIVPAISQDSTEKENGLTLMPVKGSIYTINGKGGNVAFAAGKKTVLMINASFADVTPELLKEVKKISKKPIQYVINTNHHRDHTGGNANLANTGAIIIAQDNARNHFISAMKSEKEKIREEAIPSLTFPETITLHHNKEAVLAFHIEAAQTDGDAAVFFPKTNVIHTGAAFFNGKYPYIDLENGGSIKGYIQGLTTILNMANKNTIIIPGHGKLATPTDITKTINMLTSFWKLITFHQGTGKTEAEILAMRDFTKKYDALDFGTGFVSTEKILKTIYDDVVRMRGATQKGKL